MSRARQRTGSVLSWQHLSDVLHFRHVVPASQALQRVIGDSILSRHFQQQIAKQGFTVNQLDASFDRQGVFSSRGGAFSVEMAEIQVHVAPSDSTSTTACLHVCP